MIKEYTKQLIEEMKNTIKMLESRIRIFESYLEEEE